MIPSNVDSRRPDKVQRYKPSQPNGNAPGDDLTPDYMNILGPESTTANAEAPLEKSEEQRPEQPETWPTVTTIPVSTTPISPQYGIANSPPTTNDIPSDTTTPATDTITETTAKTTDGDSKDPHSTPSRNDRFKVVKIASLEPFRRGRWKCMDYVDQTAPTTTAAIKSTQSAGTIPLYMHTQSLPQQQIQQMLVQGNYGNQQYYNVPSQMLPPNQYFYSTQPISNMQTQGLPQQIGGNVQPTVFISTTQPYIQQNVANSVAGFSVQAYPNVQYVPSNMSQNQTSAFIPTSQNVNTQISSNFQQSQTYAGQPNVSQSNIVQPIVNGHAFPAQNEQQQHPTQVAKIAILNSQPTNIQPNQVPQSMAVPTNPPQQIQGIPVQAVMPNQQYNQQITNANYQTQVNQIPTQLNQGNQQQIPQNINQQVPTNVTTVNPIPTSNPSVNQIPPIQTTVNHNPTSVSQVASVNPMQQSMNPVHSTNMQSVPQIVPQIIPILPSANMQPQFVASVGNLVTMDPRVNQVEVSNVMSEVCTDNLNAEDTTKPANPVAPQVNAIDNKIEQAMDLVKSHLMYTVREEVEILKEKITELMAKIQQLESENSFLKTQIPNLNPNGTPDPPQ